MMNFFPCFRIRRTVFLSWKYGRPLDFFFKYLLKLVNILLFHPKVQTTVFFFFLCFFFSKARSKVDVSAFVRNVSKEPLPVNIKHRPTVKKNRPPFYFMKRIPI